MKRINWHRCVPLGIDGGRTRNMLLSALSIGAAFSLIHFLAQYHSALMALYEPAGGKWVLIDGAVLPDFPVLLHGSFRGLIAVAACMPMLALLFYLSHYQDSRSIYTMRRLPNRWELHRRCLALPVLTILSCLALAALLTVLFFGIYRWAAPDACLAPGL